MRQLLFLTLIMIATSCNKKDKAIQPAPASSAQNTDQFLLVDFDANPSITDYDIMTTINWSGKREDKIISYDLQRKMETENSWIYIKSLSSSGNSELTSHTYIDKFRRTNYDASCMYRLKIYDKGDKVTYSDTIVTMLKK